MRPGFVPLLLTSAYFLGPAAADPLGDAFCGDLRAKIHSPAAGEIYFKDSTARIQPLTHYGRFSGSGPVDFYYYRNRSDVSQSEPGVVTVKISFALNKADSSAVVGLLNSSKAVPNRCNPIKIERYERFHGDSNEPNSCLQYGFHQRAPFNTLGTPARRSSFLFGASGVDTRPVTAELAAVVPSMFSNISSWFSSNTTDTSQGAAERYRSWIINYGGQQQNGTCIHFQPVFLPEYDGATIFVNDLLETRFGEHLTGNWNISLGTTK
jgi:hypothetical protein